MTPTPLEHFPIPIDHEKAATSNGNGVVISGMSGLYPQSHNIKELSEILYNKVNPVTAGDSRWNYNHPELSQFMGKAPDLDLFDAQFFMVHYLLANKMDVMARKTLEQAYQAVYDAGINPVHLQNKKVGVYIGTSFTESEKYNFYDFNSKTGLGIMGSSKTMFANRISYWLNLKGPSMAIDEACCSSTNALEQAYYAIKRGECEAAIVGGCNLCFYPETSIHYKRTIDISKDDKTKSFDQNAQGCVNSDAINVLFLQKAKDALRVYAEILHVKNEFTGVVRGDTGPQFGFCRMPRSMTIFMKQFYNEARVPPQAVEYVEAMGSATPEADKTELKAIEEIFCGDRTDPVFVGSITSNIGFTQAASGIAAVTKVLLGYHTGKLAANLHCSSPRQDVLALREGRMRVVTEHQSFGRTYVAVNGMSITGVNSHVLLHGRFKPKDPKRYKSSIPYLVALSARQESAVKYVLDSLKSHPIDPEQLRLLHNIHQTSITGHLGRGFIIFETNEEQKTVTLCEKVEYFDDARRPLWFVYSGMGSQWAGMGAQLMRIPIFAAAIERCRQVLEPKGVDIVQIITSPDEKIFDNILHSFVGIAAIQIGLTDILRELGLVPDGIIGHSVGELGCAYADGCLTAEEMILSAYSRGLVSLQTPFIRGSMAAIGLGYEQISKLCPPEIEVACHNGPESSTISGPADVMREFVAELTAKGIFAKEVPCSNIAYHSHYIADAGPQLHKYLSEVIKNPKPRSERWLSTSVPQERWNEPIAQLCSAEYHTNNLLSPVLFEETSRLVPNNAVLVEVAPHGLLQAILKRSLPSNCKNIALTRRKHPDNVVMLLEAVGKLFMEGYNPKVHILYPKIELPVSTGTPFLSHLVEWAHGEKWAVPTYYYGTKKIAAICNYIISLHDVENFYLQGHSMRGRTLYPFAASLVLVWDTFAMIMGVPKKQLSVSFNDLHLYAQPVLHDQRRLRLSVSLHRGTGSFEVISENTKVVTGYINTVVDVKLMKTRDERNKETETKLCMDLTVEDIYRLLRDRDYSYRGDFRSIECVNEAMNEAGIVWRDNWVTFIDGLLQLKALRQPHNAVSLPTHIRRMCIDVKEHKNIINESLNSEGKSLIRAKISEYLDIIRCGGITINDIKFENLPPVSDTKMVLKTLKLVSNIQSDINVSSSMDVYLQIVSENVNKENLKIVGIVNQVVEGSLFSVLKNAISNMQLEVDVKYEEITRELVLKKQNNNYLADVDLVLVQSLSTDDSLCQLLHRVLQRDQFVVSEEDVNMGSRPSSLYRVLSTHTCARDGSSQQTQLQLVRWGPAPAPTATTTVTVRTRADIALLTSTRNNLSPGHRLLVLAPYPSPRGLKQIISGWRKEAIRNKIHLVMIAKDGSDNLIVDDLPNIDLAFIVLDNVRSSFLCNYFLRNYLDDEKVLPSVREIHGLRVLCYYYLYCAVTDETINGNCRGEYYMPVRDCSSLSNNVTLQCNHIGDYDSLSWVEVPKPVGPGVTVTVHYAGINNTDFKRANGSLMSQHSHTNSYGMDFSGITENGERVMGLMWCGAASSTLRARPELLWPVPAHWSLEDAATVPLAYAQALYCLMIKTTLEPGMSILVHEGTEALGQAVISVALAIGCEVFTTVSDMRNNHLLRKIFPGLKADHIGSSRDHSFGDMVLNATNGRGCDIVISSVTGNLKLTTINCTAKNGICLDVTQLHNHDDDFSYGMYSLTKERSYALIDFASIFDHDNIEEAYILQAMLSEGISRGYVCPLSRVTFAPHDATRAFRLLVANRHRGRVLLSMQEHTPQAQPRLTCSADRNHLILCNDDTLGLKFADRLVERGARKLCVHFNGQSISYLHIKIRTWQKAGVEVVVFSDDLYEEMDITTLLKNAVRLGPVEGVYVTVGDHQQDVLETLLTTLDLESRKLCSDIKYFAILNTGDNTVGKEVCLRRLRDKLPATMLTLPELNVKRDGEGAWYRGAVEVTERAVRVEHGGVFRARAVRPPAHKTSLLHTIIALADLTVPENVNKNSTLEELGVESDKSKIISHFLRIQYNFAFEEQQIPLLTLNTLLQLETTINGSSFEDVKGLSTFFNYVDSDELLATTEMVSLPTLINSVSLRVDEFDVNKSYLYIVPGMEGHHERFRVMCERLKLPALVLQPGLDRLHETVRETAERYAQYLLQKTGIKNNFSLLGYESGVVVALEVAAILEDHGLTGTVYCVGFAPDEFKAILKEELSEFKTEEQLQDAVVRHMFTLMTGGDTTGLESALRTASTWSQKVEACVRTLLGRVPHSAQYTRALIEAALASIERARGSEARVRALRSQLVLLRPATAHTTPTPLTLQRHSQLPVAVHQLSAPLTRAASDVRVPAIINRYLATDILQQFEKENLCDRYIIQNE